MSNTGGKFKGTWVDATLWLIPLLMLLALALKFIDYGFPFTPQTQLPPQGWDDWAHLYQTFDLFHRLDIGDPLISALRDACSSVKWPPVFYLLSAAALHVCYDTAALYAVMFALAVGCLLAIYALARIYLADKRLALLAVVLFTANPVWIEAALSYNLETILLLCTAVFVALLFSLPPQRNVPWALAAGVLGSLMLLSKTVIVIPVLPLALSALVANLIRGKSGKTLGWVNPLLFLSTAALIALWWFLPHISQWQNFISTDLAPTDYVGEPPWFYLRSLAVDFPALPLLIAAFVAWISARKGETSSRFDTRTLALLVGAFFGVLIFSLIGTKHEWYLLSPYLLLALPMLRLIAAAEKSLRRALVVALFVIYGGLTLYFAAWEMPQNVASLRLYPAGHSVLRGYDNFKPPIAVVAHQLRTQFAPEDMAGLAILSSSIDDNFDWQALQIVVLRDRRYVPYLFDITLQEQHPQRWKKRQTILMFIQPDAAVADCASLINRSAQEKQPQFCSRFPAYLREHFRETRRIPIVPEYSLAVFTRVR